MADSNRRQGKSHMGENQEFPDFDDLQLLEFPLLLEKDKGSPWRTPRSSIK